VIQALREFIAMTTQKRFGTHQGEAGKEGFDAWWQQEIARGTKELESLRRLAYDAYLAGMVNNER
jgi:hypothetical protein